MGDRGPAQAEPLAQLVLSGQATVRPVDAAQDLLGEQSLELVVDRDWLVSGQIHTVMMHSWVPKIAGRRAECRMPDKYVLPDKHLLPVRRRPRRGVVGGH